MEKGTRAGARGGYVEHRRPKWADSMCGYQGGKKGLMTGGGGGSGGTPQKSGMG